MAPQTGYKVAVTNENWTPLVGVEIEAMVLSTLKPEAVVKTGLDGVATFTGLSAGPHFFKVRSRRVSTAVDVQGADRVRSYTGKIRLQVIAMGNQGITKHFIVDANGMGTHLTAQEAFTAALAQTDNNVVIYVNPGSYGEIVSCDFGDFAGTGELFIYLVGEGSVSNWYSGFYNKVVKIATPVANAASPTFDFQGVGSIQMVGIYVDGRSGGSVALGDGATDDIDFEARNCGFDAGGNSIFRNGIGSIGAARVFDSLCTGAAASLIESTAQARWFFHHCRINTKGGFVDGNFSTLEFVDCQIYPGTGLANWWIEEAALVNSGNLLVQGCHYHSGGSGFIKVGQSNATTSVIRIINNVINNDAGDTAIYLIGILLSIVKNNIIIGSANDDGGIGIRISEGNVKFQAGVVGNNSFDLIQTGIQVDASATDGSNVFGPNAYGDVGTETTGVPGGEDFQVSKHALLDGTVHTDTVAQAVTRGSLIYGNASSPSKWDELVVGGAGTVLISDGTDPSWSGSPALSGTLTVNTINEYTGDAGVTIENVLLKDDKIVAHGTEAQIEIAPGAGVTPALRLRYSGGASWDIQVAAQQFYIASNSLGTALECFTADFGVCRIGQNASDPFSTHLSGYAYALHLDYYVDPSGASATDYFNLELIGKLAGAQNITGSIQNAVYILRHEGTGTLDRGVGITTEYYGTAAGVTTLYQGYWIKIPSLSGGSTITTFVGIDFDDISQAGVGTVIGIRSQETDVPLQWAGDARFGATGAPASPVEVIDANFALDIVSSNPRLTVDSGDYLEFNRANNYFYTPDAFQIGGHVGIGAVVSATVGVDVAETLTATSGFLPEVQSTLTANPGGASSAVYPAVWAIAQTQAANAQNLTAYPSLLGVEGRTIHQGSGLVTDARAFEAHIRATSSGDYTKAYGFYVRAQADSTGVPITLYDIYVADMTGAGGNPTTQYGLYLEDLDRATTNYGIYFAGASGLARQGIWWNGDTNLYRSAANILKTDDKFLVALELEIDGDLNHDGSNVGLFGAAPVAQSAGWAMSNVTLDKIMDCDITTIDEVADVLGSLVDYLKTLGPLAA